MPPPAPAAPRLPWAVLAVPAIAAVALCAVLVGSRIGYPFELEWMEGAMVDHAARVHDGRPLYCEPGPEHVPFLYTPLLFWLGAAGMAFSLPGLLALRLVSLLSTLALAALLGHWVRRETGRVLPGIVAIGLLAAGYGWLKSWYDLARNDTLFAAFALLAAYLLRWHGARMAVLAGAAATLAFLAKQSALMWLPAIATGALLLDWRRGLCFVGASAIGIGAAVLLLHVGTDGWSTFFVFTMPGAHGIEERAKLGFWTEDLVPIAPTLLLALGGCVAGCRAGHWRQALFLAAVGSGGLVTSYMSRLHTGGYDNVLLFAFVGACLLAPVAAANARSVTGGLGACALLLLQFASLVFDVRCAWLDRPLWLYRPQATQPGPGHRRAHEELAAFVRRQPGEVFVLGHGNVSGAVGKPRTAHAQAIFDLLQALPRHPDGTMDLLALLDPDRLARLPGRTGPALQAFYGRFHQALQQQRFAAIVLDLHQGGGFEATFAAGLAGRYRRSPEPLLTEPAALQAPVGMVTHSPYALVPVR